ncbi:MAG: hypothetical protein ACE5FT_01710 [Candidatus Nanoarchaeia archaeon]
MARRKRSASSGSSCPACPAWFNWLFLLAGLLLLLRDFGMNYLGGAQWYSLLITLFGLKWVSMSK